MREIIRTVSRFVKTHLNTGDHRSFGVYTLPFRFDVTGEHDGHRVLQERSEIDAFDMYLCVIEFVVNIVGCLQLGFAALVLRITGHIDPHGLQIHLRRIEVRFSTHLVRTDMQAVTGNTIFRQIDTRIAIDSVRRNGQFAERESQSAYVQSPCIVFVRTYVHQRLRGQRARPDSHVHRREPKTDIPQLAVRYVECEQQGCRVLHRSVRRRVAQIDGHIGIIETKTMQRVLAFGNT